jgi:hypothetical protein
VRVPIISSRLVDGDRELVLQPDAEALVVSPLIHVQSIDLGFPSIRAATANTPGADGTDDRTKYLGARGVSITANLWGDAVTRPFQLLDQVRRFCWPNARPELRYVVDGEDGERRVVLRADTQSAPVTIDKRTSIAFQASWVCPSGLQESADEQLVTAYPFTDAPGVAVPFDVPFDLPASSGGSLAVADNHGNYEAWPVIRIYGPAVSVRVRNLTTGAQLYLPFATIGAGDYLELDSNPGRRTALLNSDTSANRFDLIDWTTSTWFRLADGPNEIEFSAITWSAPAQAVITYRHTWL